MSTVSVTNLKHASSASNNIVLDSSGNATFAGTAVPASSFLRNRIINGDMRIDQRNAGAAVTYTNSVGYGIDRWRNVALGTSLGFSIARSTTVPTGSGFTNSLLATVTTAKNPASTDQARVNQYIEGFNISDLDWGTANAKTVTLSFWVRSSVTGTYCVALSNADSATRSYVATYSISAANTWEQKSITILGDTSGTWTTSNSVGIGVSFALGSGTSFNAASASTWYGAEYQQTSAQTLWINNASATFYLTGVQLEVGSAATPFERRQYGQELALCQRYYQRDVLVTVGGGATPASTNRQFFNSVQWPVQMRAAPTMALISTITSTNMNAGSWAELTISRGRFTATNSVANDCTLFVQYDAAAEL